MDWAAYLKHLQIVFHNFDIEKVILELILIHLFCNGLYLSIHAKAK